MRLSKASSGTTARSAHVNAHKTIRSLACNATGNIKSSLLVTMSTVLLLNTQDAMAIIEPIILQGPPRIVDGDTLYVEGQKIRLYGVDAPEKAQICKDANGKGYECGKVSLEALTTKLNNSAVQCQVKNKDQYGRNVATCAVLKGNQKEDVGDWLVTNGLAVAYRQYGKEYIPAEEAAHAAHKGIWQGDFQIPSEWRKAQKNDTAAQKSNSSTQKSDTVTQILVSSFPVLTAPPVKCITGPPIKGNIGSGGEKIYHVPGGRYYENVQIDVEDGEKFFCSEAEAQAAGWRKSKA